MARLVLAILLMLLAGRPLAAGEPRSASDLSLADLGPYRAALEGRPEGPAAPVTFRALWDHPERYQGTRVAVQGRVARRFRQGAFGTFPALIEAWITNEAGDPFCVIFPDAGVVDTSPGATIRFEGVFLRKLQYQGADTTRLAPLIVGNLAPKILERAAARSNPASDVHSIGRSSGFGAVEWVLGIAMGLVVLAVLAWQHLRAPGRRPLTFQPDEFPPVFVEESRSPGTEP